MSKNRGDCLRFAISQIMSIWFGDDNIPVALFTEEVISILDKRPLVFNGLLSNSGITSLIKEAAYVYHATWTSITSYVDLYAGGLTET